MVNESLALHRVGEWADLPDELLHAYLEIVTEVHSEKLDEVDDFDGFKGVDYFKFLNENVLSDARVVDQLRQFGIEQSKLEDFQQGTVPIEDTYSTLYKLDYGLDQVADFVMMLKFFHDYIDITGGQSVKPRNRLQYLLYLVNYEISKDDDLGDLGQQTDLGNLEHTGYRYTFNKGGRGPYSSTLYQDKNRLFAQEILDEQVMDEDAKGTNEPYEITIGATGERVLSRYGYKLSQFESVLMKEWDLKQRDVIEEQGQKSQKELESEVQSIPHYEQSMEGDELLPGRPRNFDTPIDPVMEEHLNV